MQPMNLARRCPTTTRVAILLLLISPLLHGQVTDPGQSVTPEDMVEDAIRKIDAGDFVTAQRIYEHVRRIKPDLFRLRLIEGLLLVEMGKPLEALSRLEEFNRSKEAGNEWRGYAAVGRIYQSSRMNLQAVHPLERAKDFAPLELSGRPIKAEIAMDLATVLNALTRTKDALKVADEAAAMAPNDAGIQLKLGKLHLAGQDYSSALRCVERGITIAKAQLRADPFKGEENLQFKQLQDLKLTIHQAQRAANPDDPAIYVELSKSMRDQAESERRIRLLAAREYALEAVNRDPRSGSAQVFLAMLEWELGAAPDALDRLKRLLEEDPNNAEALQLRGQIQASLNTNP